MNRKLHRLDVVGKRIAVVLTGPIDSDADGFSGCEAFVRLEDGTTFEMIMPPAELWSVDDPAEGNTHPFTPLGDPLTCSGEKIVDVCDSTRWASIAVVLESSRILVLTDEFSPRHVRPSLLRLGESYTTNHLLPYW
jgi:hypothetical protein